MPNSILRIFKKTHPFLSWNCKWTGGCTVLKTFYAKVRKKNRTRKAPFGQSGFGLNRHFKEVLKIDIMKDKEFNEAHRVYIAQCVGLKKQGLAKTEHIPLIVDKHRSFRYGTAAACKVGFCSLSVNIRSLKFIEIDGSFSPSLESALRSTILILSRRTSLPSFRIYFWARADV